MKKFSNRLGETKQKATFTLAEVEGMSPCLRKGLGGDLKSSEEHVSPSLEFVSSPQLTNKFFSLPRREWRNENRKSFSGQSPLLGRGLGRGYYKKAAFTLVEVLITLGVIGVVVAMTMPALIKNYQKKVTISKLKKAFSQINQAYRMSYSNNTEIVNSEDLSSKQYFDKYYAPYIKAIKYCDNYKECGYKNNYPYKYADRTTYVGYDFIVFEKHFAFITSDGILFRIPREINYASKNINDFMIVDLNGANSPNMLGKDVFYLKFNKSDISAYCFYNSENYVNTQCSLSHGSGVCCAMKIIRDGWEIKDDYPW